MLTLEKLREIAIEAATNDEWICLKTGLAFHIFRVASIDVDALLMEYSEHYNELGTPYLVSSEDFVYTDADHAKDWNYFKNTMGI